MTQLLGLIDVMLRGLGLVAFVTAVGGVVFVFAVLRARGPAAAAPAALERSLRLIALASAFVATTQVAGATAKLWALAPSDGPWPLRTFLSTPYGTGAMTKILIAAALAVVAGRLLPRPPSRSSWTSLGVLAVLLTINSTALSHSIARLDGRAIGLVFDALHRAGAAVWLGGLVHFVAVSRLANVAREPSVATRMLRRVSTVALIGVTVIALAGAALALSYVDSVAGLLGTGYGVMLLTKLVLLGAALTLGAANFVAVRRHATTLGGVLPRVRWLVEAEIGLGVTILLTAASLTSLPPAVDVRADRADVSEVAARFMPRVPRLTSPPVDDLLATAAPITDLAARRQPAEYAWSEYNHHMAGLFVLAMGALAGLARVRAARWARHWPLLLLGLAAFMFVRNDPRAWPLGPAGFWETLVLADVLQHRISVGLVIALGVFEWCVRTGRLRWPGWRFAFPVLCAVGGGLLLTHSHAMFNIKAEFLSEVAHTPLGILGVFIAGGRWLELRLPAPDNRLPGRMWPACMMLLGLVLVSYREG